MTPRRRIIGRPAERAVLAAVLMATGTFLLGPSVALAATDGSYQDVYWVNSCTAYGNTAPAFSGTASGVNWNTADQCARAGNRSLEINVAGTGTVVQGKSGKWATITPSAAIKIIGVYTPPSVNGYPNPLADCTLGSDGFSADYFWGDNGVNYGSPAITVNCHGSPGLGQAGYMNQKFTPSRYFGWQATCAAPTCQATAGGDQSLSGDVFGVSGISLEAQETSGPALDAVGASNLYYQTGWVRGSWPTDLAATDPSGVCSLQTAINGTAINTYVDSAPDTSRWSQCAGSSLPSSVDTSGYANGPRAIALWFYSSNAAGASSIATRSINVDNAPVSLSLSGPTNAPSTAGTQYVTASATAGPSGVAGIWCTVDGGAFGWHSGASAQIPVAGLGIHSVSCHAQDNALNSSGADASSGTQTWQLTIGQPTLAAISFSKLIDALRCRRLAKGITVPGRLHTVHRHGRKLRVRGRPRRTTIRVIACHPRTVRRRMSITVTIHRHGQRVRVKRTVVLPRRVDRPSRRVGFGHGSPVSGWLGLSDGTALPDRTVRVLSAPDDGRQNFSQTAIVKTAADGSWTAKLPPGPSRLVRAVYAGGATTEGTFSSVVRLIVPAKVKIATSPRQIRWGGTIHISGRVLGRYIPNGSKLLRLDIGIAALHAIQGIPQLSPDGRFSTTYAFNRSSGTVRFYFTVATLAEADYPFAPGRSRRIIVTVGGPSRCCCCRSGRFPK